MSQTTRTIILFFVSLLVGFIAGYLIFGAYASAQDRPIRIAVSGEPPFVENGTDGIAVDIWEQVAHRAGLSASSYELQHFENFDRAMAAVNNGEADGFVGPVSITSERLNGFQFTQPFYEANMGVLTRDNSSWIGFITPFVRQGFLKNLLLFLFMIFMVGFVVWLFEKKQDEEFRKKPWGILDGTWWAIVTMTTVGYGDKVPRTAGGKVVGAIWMFCSILLFSTITAFMTAALTTHDSEFSIERSRVAVIEGTTSVQYATERGANTRIAENLTEAVQALEQNRVDAVVFDAPSLQQYASQHTDAEYEVFVREDHNEYYGFMFGQNFDQDLLRRINVAIIQMQESSNIQTIVDQSINSL
jgi:polar amino acid transport system substrate-binding protein